MSETPIGDEVARDLGVDNAPEFDDRTDDGTDDVTEDVPEPDLGEAPEVDDDQGEALDGAAEDESEDAGEPEPDEAPIQLESPYTVPDEPAR